MHVKVVPHRLTNLLSQHYIANVTELVFCQIYLSKGFPIIVCWPYIHIIFIWYPDLCMHNTRSPPILKKNGYILNIWSSCGQIGALLIKIRSNSRVLDNPVMILQLLIEKLNLSIPFFTLTISAELNAHCLIIINVLFICFITSSRFNCDTSFALGR